MNLSTKYIKQVKTIISLVLLVTFAFWKIRLGVHSDEVHSIAVGDMIGKGNSFFKECWFYLQMSSVFTAPVIYLYQRIFGNKEGILLLFRVLSVCIQSSICIYFYSTFKKIYQKKYVLFACLLLFTFIPDFQSFTYKQELLWFTTLEIIFSYKYYFMKKKKYLVLLGTVIACSVLAYPTAIIQFPLYIILIYYLNKDDTKKWIKDSLTVAITCFICALFFLIIIFSQISIAEFIEFFPKVFIDENLDKSFLTKLYHPVKKFAVLGIITVLPILIYERGNMFRRLMGKVRIPIVTCLLCFAFLGQMFIERSGITWHCICYSYALTIFIVPLAYFLNENKEKDRLLFILFEIPTIVLVLCIALASNQGNITSMYATVFSAAALMLMLGNENNTKGIIIRENQLIAMSLCICALSMYLIPVYEQETVMPNHTARTIFTERFLALNGPAKGIYLGSETYEQYLKICQVVEENVSEDDNVFIIDDAYTSSYGYLASKGNYATYSPQGGWGLAESDKAVEYFMDNPQKKPTVVIIRLDYIGQELNNYLEETPVGNYLLNNEYVFVEKNEGYVVMKMI